MNWRMLFFSRDETLIADVPVTEAQAEALLASDNRSEIEKLGSCFPVQGWLEATDTPDPIVEAERAVVEAALEWNRSGEDEGLQAAVDALIRLRAAQASQGSGTAE